MTLKNVVVPLAVLLFAFQPIMAQEDPKEQTLEVLREQLATVEEEEKKALKKQIENINSLWNNGVIDKREADRLKLKAAEDRSEIIEERQAVLLETIAYLENRKNTPKTANGAEIFLDIDSYFAKGDSLPTTTKTTPSTTPASPPPSTPSPDSSAEEPLPGEPDAAPQNLQEANNPDIQESRNRTSLDVVFAFGLNNTVKEGITWYDIEDEEDYFFYSSRFLEIGLALKTPLVEKNGLRLKYGLSYQWNKLVLNGNRYFNEVDGQTLLEVSSRYLGDSRFVLNNLVVPVHLEFGPTEKRRNDNGNYHSTRHKFKIGLGGYAGLNLNARQWVQHRHRYGNIRFITDESIDGYDVNRQIYGLSAYVGIGAFSIYGKYDLNPIFENGAEDEQFVSVGLRLDL